MVHQQRDIKKGTDYTCSFFGMQILYESINQLLLLVLRLILWVLYFLLQFLLLVQPLHQSKNFLRSVNLILIAGKATELYS